MWRATGWQIDLWRKRGLNRLAADFGPRLYLARTRRHAFPHNGDMDVEWRSYAEDARDICTAFVGGIQRSCCVERNEIPPA